MSVTIQTGNSVAIQTGNRVIITAPGPQGPPGSGGGGSPGGLNTQVQFNDGGSFGGDAGLTYNKTTDTLTATNLTVNGLSTLAHIHGSLAGNLYVHVKNASGVTIAKGTPVYATGSVGTSGEIEVAAADFTNSAKMPAIGITDAQLIVNAEGNAVVVGEITGLATNIYTINQELFVGTAALTGTLPTTGEVQSVAIVSRVHASTGIIVVNTQARLNAALRALANSDGSGLTALNASNITSGSLADAYIASAATWNAKQDAGSYITALTGDVTASGPGSASATLANTAVTPGSYTSANITVDSKGRITAAEDGAAIDLATEVTGTLDDAYIASAATWNAKLDANGDGSSLTGITAAQVGAIADGDTLATGLIFPITNGIRILDAAGDHALGINLEGELSANRGLTFAVNDANRQIDLSGNLTVSAAATVSGTNTGDQAVGTTAGTVAAGDDSRFTDARTPTAHASSHVTGGTDKIRDATASQDGLATATQIAKLDGIEAGANNYTLPAPTTTVIGGVKRNTGSAGQFVNGIDTDGSLQYGTPAGSGSGTVTSVAISGTDGIEVDSGSPITTDGTIQLGVNAATMKTTLDLTGTNSGDVTLAGTPDYITISGQTITRNAIDLATDVTGTLPAANGGTGITALGTGVATALGQNVTGSGSIVLGTSPTLTTPALGTPSALTLTNATGLPLTTGVTGILPIANIATGTPDGTKFVRDDGTLATPAGSGTVTSVGGTGTVNGITLSGTVTSAGNLTLGGTLSGVDLTTQVTGTLPIANGGTGQTTQTAAFDALAPTTTKGDLIVHNGTDNVRVPVGTDGHSLVADSTQASGVKWAAGGGGGGPPAAIEAIKTDTFTFTNVNETWADVPGLSVTITPSSTSKKVCVILTLNGSLSGNHSIGFRVLRDATPVGIADASGSRLRGTGQIPPNLQGFYSASTSVTFTDSPASTSALTYKIQVTNLTGGAATSHINRTHTDANATYTLNSISVIRVQEVD